MKFTTREDVSAPIEQVFEALRDFEGFERQAMRRGIEVRRTDNLKKASVGLCWQVAFELRGRKRDITLELVRFESPNEMAFKGKSSGIDADFVIELMALSRTRTRMAVNLEITPLNLSARLLVQSLKLAKNNLTKRFKLKVASYAKTLEDRLQRTS
ncbi:MAG: SRPBCC family protein [Tateyamaria sp.]|uniref:SRPBCC family protein n=1 Tax=Tateyamaria sp. TaxID=1929288 RepID=UPI00329B3DE5